jgi:hypothetical protein
VCRLLVARTTDWLSALLFKCQVGFSVTVGDQVGWAVY